jgi:hypothetical protein
MADLQDIVLRAYQVESSAPKFATKTSGGAAGAHLVSGTLFNFTGTVIIDSFIGRITTDCEAAENKVGLYVTCDALAAYYFATHDGLDLNHKHAGTLITITGTAGNALATDVVGALAPAQANPVIATCITSGVIGADFSVAAKDGGITWEVVWRPGTADSTLTAA